MLGYQILRKKSKTIAVEETDITKTLVKIGDGSELSDYGKALLKFGERSEINGQGVGYVDVFGQPTILISNPEMARKVLGHSVKHSLWGGLTAASKAFFGDNVLFVLEGSKWRGLRNVIKHSLLQQNVDLMLHDVVAEAKIFTEKIEVNEELDFNQLLGLYHLSAIGKSAFNFDLDCLSSKNLGPSSISEAFDFFIDELPRRSLNPDQSVAGDYTSKTEDNKKWNGAANLVRNTIKEVVSERLLTIVEAKKLQDGKTVIRKDLLSAMIHLSIEENTDAERKVSEEEKYSVEFLKNLVKDITDNLVEILFAGYNTNVGTMANCLHFLALNPTAQEKCQNEVDLFFKKYKPEDDLKVYVLSNYDSSKFKFIENSFLETLRLRPPAPMLARQLTKSFEFETPSGKLVLPENSPVWFPVEFLQRNSEHWMDYDANTFQPERFSLKKPCTVGSFLAFSGGPRDCIGKNFAKLEAIVALVLLLRKFDFHEVVDYKYKAFFNGFGYRPFDENTGKVSMKLVAKLRKDVKS